MPIFSADDDPAAAAAEGEILLGVKEKVAPAGSPETPSETVPLKPPEGLMFTVYAAPPPGVTDCEAGVALIVKSAVVGPFTTNVTVVE